MFGEPDFVGFVTKVGVIVESNSPGRLFEKLKPHFVDSITKLKN